MYSRGAYLLGGKLNLKAAAASEKVLSKSLAKTETFWLNGNGKFLLGNFQPTIADLSLVCELMQLEVNLIFNLDYITFQKEVQVAF